MPIKGPPNATCKHCGYSWFTKGVFHTVGCPKCKKSVRLRERKISRS